PTVLRGDAVRDAPRPRAPPRRPGDAERWKTAFPRRTVGTRGCGPVGESGAESFPFSILPQDAGLLKETRPLAPVSVQTRTSVAGCPGPRSAAVSRPWARPEPHGSGGEPGPGLAQGLGQANAARPEGVEPAVAQELDVVALLLQRGVHRLVGLPPVAEAVDQV